jgi:subtilase family serine protease
MQSVKIETVLIVFGTLCSAQVAPQPSRINSPIDDRKIVKTNDYVPALSRAASDLGGVPASFPLPYLTLTFQPSPQQQQQLRQLLLDQQDRKSAKYHQWLTPDEYGERFGIALQDLEAVRGWLESSGFHTIRIARARNWIAFSGSAGDVQRTFHTSIHQYVVGDEIHFANAAAPSIPAALGPIVSGLRGLDDFRPKPQVRKNRGAVAPDYTNLFGSHYLAPDDIATIYDLNPLYAAGNNGTGQRIAVVGQTDVDLSVIGAFRTIFNLPDNPPQLLLYGPDPGVRAEDQLEADLDLEWTGAVARNSTILYVYSTDVFNSVRDAIDDNLAPVISMSYGGCEAEQSLTKFADEQRLAQQANAQGITWLASSGDWGAADCDAAHPSPPSATHGYAVIFPASIPEVTAVGGTEFNENGVSYWNYLNGSNEGSAISYIPERVWNDTEAKGTLDAGGGGDSTRYGVPWWQVGEAFGIDPWRELPDVSLTASDVHDGYMVCTGSAPCPVTWKLLQQSGGFEVVGGTSASTPVFAGMVALLNQYLAALGGEPGLGNINPNLYWLAINSPSAFHDITTGNNIVPCILETIGCSSGTLGFSAVAGYDRASGLGSIDANNLVTAWAFTSGVQTEASYTAGGLTLSQGQSIQIGLFTLVMQGDGNLVLYEQSGPAVWSSGTYGQNCGSDQCFAVFQIDGNFVVYNGSTALWNSGTYGNPGAELVLSAQSPQLQIIDGNQTLWLAPQKFGPGNLMLAQGDSVNFGPYILVMQNDGNLVIYQSEYGPAVWSSGTYGQNCGSGQCFAVFQTDGNFVVYNGSTPLWNSGTYGNPGAELVLSAQSPQLEVVAGASILWTDQAVFSAGNLILPQGAWLDCGDFILVMQNDGNLVLYQATGPAVWATGTYGQNCGAGQCLAVFQGDGNFVVYNGASPLWNSGTWGNPAAQLIVPGQTAELQIVGDNQAVLWTNF